MNILIYSTNSHYDNIPVGGAEISLRIIAEKFAQLKEDVYYATIHQSKMPGFKKKKIKGVKVYSLSPFKAAIFGWKVISQNMEKIYLLPEAKIPGGNHKKRNKPT